MADPCQLCGSVETGPISQRDRNGNPLQTVICLGCGIVTNDPIPTQAELDTFYGTRYRREYKKSAGPRMRQVWRNFHQCRHHIRSCIDVYGGRRHCLDVGAGSGEFMFLADAMGIECTGIEPSADYAGYCRDMLGLDVRTQTLEETEFAEGQFDLIRLTHVLEHMREPVTVLKTLRQWLSEDGVLHVEVPNLEIDAYRRMKGRLFHYGHIFNFNSFTLRMAAGLAGLAEMPGAPGSGRNTTSLFFVRAGPHRPPAEEAAQNAARLQVILEEHYARTIPQPRKGTALSRFVNNAKMRSREIVASRRFRTHRQIAEHFREGMA